MDKDEIINEVIEKLKTIKDSELPINRFDM
jgi:metal-sulfur cluster biosynthetic enzyme